MGFTGPGIACDWLDVEGPLHDVWPPRSHQRLFGDLPLVEFKPAEHPKTRGAETQAGPAGDRRRQESARSGRRASGPCTASSRWSMPIACSATSCRGPFAGRSMPRRASSMSPRSTERLKAGDCFETAMRWAYRAALCSPDFLYHVEPAGKLDDHALACRLSYFFWNSMPDEQLTAPGRRRQAARPATCCTPRSNAC